MVGGSKRKITQTAVINIVLLGTVVGFTAGCELQLLSRQDLSDEGFYILKCCERPGLSFVFYVRERQFTFKYV